MAESICLKFPSRPNLGLLRLETVGEFGDRNGLTVTHELCNTLNTANTASVEFGQCPQLIDPSKMSSSILEVQPFPFCIDVEPKPTRLKQTVFSIFFVY